MEIYIIGLDGKEQVRLTRDPAYDTAPRWSADGKRIIFASNRDGGFAIYEMIVSP